MAPPFASAAELSVEVIDVEGQDLFGSGGRFVQETPQESFPQRVAAVDAQFLQPDEGDGAVAAVGGLAPARAAGRVGGQEVLALGPGGEGDQGGPVPVPGGGRGEMPALHHRRVLLGSQLHDGVARAGDGGQASEGVGVAGAGGGGGQGGQEALDRLLRRQAGCRLRGVGGRESSFRRRLRSWAGVPRTMRVCQVIEILCRRLLMPHHYAISR